MVLCDGKSQTGNPLANMGVINQDQAVCPMCNNALEINSYLFSLCKVSWSLWTTCLEWWRVSTTIHESTIVNIESWSTLDQCTFKTEL